MQTILKQLIINFHNITIPVPNPREFQLPRITPPVRKAFIFAGMRRSGKTWAMYWQMQQLLQQGIPRAKLLYLNFEDDRLSGMQSVDFQAILDAYFSLYPQYIEADDIHFFFDEIHEIPGWEKFIRRLLDQEKIQLYISGSSSRMLGKEIASALRGRTVLQEIFPYNLREYLSIQQVSVNSHLSSKQQAVAAHFTEIFLLYGGFPEAVALAAEFHRELLQGYIDVVIYRDIIERHKITNTHITRSLLTYCLQNLASLLSINKLYNRFKSQGEKVGKDYLYELMEYLQDAYCLFSLPLFTFSAEKQAVNPKKIYAVDQGFITAYTVKPEFEEAARLENAVFCALRHKTEDIFYYKTRDGKEVDFIVSNPNGQKSLYQVCTSLADEKTRKREVAALKQAMQELAWKNGIIISLNENRTIKTDAGEIRVLPFARWAAGQTGF